MEGQLKNLGKKIVAVMEAVTNVAKDKTNSHFNYRYASDEAIVTAVRAEAVKQKLVFIPNQLEVVKNGDFTRLHVEYTILDADSGESVQTRVYGEGQDKGDKGVYKAATGAEKYFLLKTFLIPTGDDPENDGGASRSTKASTTTTQKPTPAPSNGTTQTMIETAMIRIGGVEAFKTKDNGTYWKALDHEGVPYFIFDEVIRAQAETAVAKKFLMKAEFLRQPKKGLKLLKLTVATPADVA